MRDARFPTRSTVAAWGTVCRVAGRTWGRTSWQWHVRHRQGSDWLGDTGENGDLAREAPQGRRHLQEGKIYQRPFGGHTTRFGEGPGAAHRAPPPTSTGHAILHTLYGQSLKEKAEFFIEYFALDLIITDGRYTGVVLEVMGGGDPCLQRQDGGAAAAAWPRLFQRATSAHTCTGDGGGAGGARGPASLQDMEFVQFHPTGIYGSGCLITGRAAEGGYLTNSEGERLMERYAPTYKDLASATWFRAASPSRSTRAAASVNKDHMFLDLVTCRPAFRIGKILPASMSRASRSDPAGRAARNLGGIPRGLLGRGAQFQPRTPAIFPGLMAVGETGCASVRRTNRASARTA